MRTLLTQTVLTAAMLSFSRNEKFFFDAISEEIGKETAESKKKTQAYDNQFARNLRCHAFNFLGRSNVVIPLILLRTALEAVYPFLYIAVGKDIFGEDKVKKLMYLLLVSCRDVSLMI